MAEFNRLANLAQELGLRVEAEVHRQAIAGRQSPRPVLMVRVVTRL